MDRLTSVPIKTWSPFVAITTVVALALTTAGTSRTADAQEPGSTKSGGRAVVHQAGGKPVSPAGHRVPKATRLSVGQEAAEPTIGLTDDGDMFYVALRSNTRVDVLRSTNKGKSWDMVSPNLGGRNAHLVTFDPYLYVDTDTSRVYTIDLTVACSYLSYSDDRGESWITNPLACGRPINDHQTLFSGPPVTSTPVGYDNVVYYCWNDVASSSCSKSLDGGVTFSPTGTPAFPGVSPEGRGFCGGLHGHGYVGRDGTVFLPRGWCREPYLAISKDEGATWTRVKVADNGSADHEASVATDPKGNIYYTYIAENRLPYLVVSRDGGESWGKPMMIGPPGLREANIPTLDAGGAGKVVIAYMGSENSRYPLCTEQCTNDDYKNVTWHGYMTMTAGALGKNPVFYTSTVNHKRDPLKRQRCGPGRCGTAIYDFIDVVIGPDGTPYGAFVDGCLFACSSPAGSGDMGNEGIVGSLVGGPKLN